MRTSASSTINPRYQFLTLLGKLPLNLFRKAIAPSKNTLASCAPVAPLPPPSVESRFASGQECWRRTKCPGVQGPTRRREPKSCKGEGGSIAIKRSEVRSPTEIPLLFYSGPRDNGGSFTAPRRKEEERGAAPARGRNALCAARASRSFLRGLPGSA